MSATTEPTIAMCNLSATDSTWASITLISSSPHLRLSPPLPIPSALFSSGPIGSVGAADGYLNAKRCCNSAHGGGVNEQREIEGRKEGWGWGGGGISASLEKGGWVGRPERRWRRRKPAKTKQRRGILNGQSDVAEVGRHDAPGYR